MKRRCFVWFWLGSGSASTTVCARHARPKLADEFEALMEDVGGGK